RRILAVTGEPFLVGAHHAGGRAVEPFALRFVAGPADQGAHGLLDVRPRRAGDGGLGFALAVTGFDGVVHASLQVPPRRSYLRCTAFPRPKKSGRMQARIWVM